MAAADKFNSDAASLLEPYRRAAAIAPHATDELAEVTRGLMVGATGTVVMRLKDDSADVTLTLISGVIYPLRVRAVRNTSGATGIVGLY